MGLPLRELQLKDFPRRQGRLADHAARPVGSAAEADLAFADVDPFELDVVAAVVRGVADHRHGEFALALPGDVEPLRLRVLGDPVEDFLGGDGEHPRPNLLEGQLQHVRPRDVRPGDHPDHRADRPLVEPERQRDAVDLEPDAGLVDFRRELIGEVRDEVLGEPGVDLLVAEDGLPGRLVADVVAELEALGDEPLRLLLAVRGAAA